MSRRKPGQKPKPEPGRWGPVIVALIGAAAVIIAAVIARLPAGGGSQPTAPARITERIEFAAPGDPGALNPALAWDQGASSTSRFAVADGGLTLTAGARTWPGFPTLTYTAPLAGNFDAQVKAVFKPPVMAIANAQMVGLIIRPANARLVMGMERFPLNWVIVSKQLVDAGPIVGCRSSWEDYAADTVYLRIERDAESWRCAYSENGETWRRMPSDVEVEALRDEPLEMALFAYSGTGDPITVEFSDWILFRPGAQ